MFTAVQILCPGLAGKVWKPFYCLLLGSKLQKAQRLRPTPQQRTLWPAEAEDLLVSSTICDDVFKYELSALGDYLTLKFTLQQ